MNKNARFAEVKPHIHDWIELGYMYSGSCVQTVRGKTVELKKGQIIILDSGIPHAIGRTGEDDIIVNLMFEKKYFTYSFFTRLSEESIVTEFLMNAISKQTSHDNYIFFDSQDDRRVQTFMKELICEFLSPTNMARDMINNLIALLFSSLVNSYEKKEAEGTAFPKSNYMVEILRYMEDNFRSCTLTDTAKKFNVNPGYLSEMLKKTMGYGFRELMMEHRLSYAASLLRGTYLPCEKIIADAGFGNNTYFYKKFREKYGCLPKDYRGREHNS